VRPVMIPKWRVVRGVWNTVFWCRAWPTAACVQAIFLALLIRLLRELMALNWSVAAVDDVDLGSHASLDCMIV
jgi:hypothetical protein